MPFATLNNCRFDYDVQGKGRAIVFVHGENQGPEIWEYQVPDFSLDFKCVNYARRGHGKTELSEYGYSVENQTYDLIALLDYLEIDKAVLVSAAFGTTIAANFALTHPERTRAVVLIGWSELDGARKHIDKWHKQTLEIVNILHTQGKEGLKSLIRKKDENLVAILPHDPKIREKFIELYTNRPPEAFFKRMEAVTSTQNLLAKFQEIKIPILGVHGEKDLVPDMSHFTRSMPNLKVVTIPNAERFVQWERPTEFNEILRMFLTSIL